MHRGRPTRSFVQIAFRTGGIQAVPRGITPTDATLLHERLISIERLIGVAAGSVIPASRHDVTRIMASLLGAALFSRCRFLLWKGPCQPLDPALTVKFKPICVQMELWRGTATNPSTSGAPPTSTCGRCSGLTAPTTCIRQGAEVPQRQCRARRSPGRVDDVAHVCGSRRAPIYTGCGRCYEFL